MSLAFRHPWTDEEDSAVKRLIAEHGTHNWTLISKELADKYSVFSRTGKQCRERWKNHLNPAVDKSPWSKVEDSKILDLWRKMGKAWTSIARYFPGRSENSVKNRFYSSMRKYLRKYNKTRPYSKRFTGSVRTLLRNTQVLDQLFKEVNQDDRDEESLVEKPDKAECLEADSKFLTNSQKIHSVSRPGPQDDASLLFNLSYPYLYFYPQASYNYKPIYEFSNSDTHFIIDLNKASLF